MADRKPLTLCGIPKGTTMSQQFNAVTFYFPKEEQAENFWLTMKEAFELEIPMQIQYEKVEDSHA